MSAEIATPGIMRNDFNIQTMAKQRLAPASSRSMSSPETSAQQAAGAESSESESEDEEYKQRLESRQSAIEKAKAARALQSSAGSSSKPPLPLARVSVAEENATSVVTTSEETVTPIITSVQTTVTQLPPELRSTSTTQNVTVTQTTRTVMQSIEESDSEDDAPVEPVQRRQDSSDRAAAARALLATTAQTSPKKEPTFVRVPASVTNIEEAPAQSTPAPATETSVVTSDTPVPPTVTVVQTSVTQLPSVLQSSSSVQNVTVTQTTRTVVESAESSDSDDDGPPVPRRQDSSDRAAAARALLAATAVTPPKKEPTFVRVPASVTNVEEAPAQSTPVSAPPPDASQSMVTSATFEAQPPPPVVDISGALVLPTEGVSQYITEEQQRYSTTTQNVTTSQEVSTEKSTETRVESVVVEVPPEDTGPVDNSDLMAIMEMARNAAALAAQKEAEEAAAQPAPSTSSARTILPPVKYTPPPRALTSLSQPRPTPPPSDASGSGPSTPHVVHQHQTHSVSTTKTVVSKHHDHHENSDGTADNKTTTSITVMKTLDISSDSDDDFKSSKGAGKDAKPEAADAPAEKEPRGPQSVRVSNFASQGMVKATSFSNTDGGPAASSTTISTMKEISFISLSSDSEDSGVPIRTDFMQRIAERKSMREELDKYNKEAEKPEPTFVHIAADEILPVATPVNVPAPSPKHDMQYDTIYAEEIKEQHTSASKKYSVTRMSSVAVVEVDSEPEMQAEPVYTSEPESDPRSRYYRAQSPEYATQLRLLEEAAAQRALMRASSFTQSEKSNTESFYTSSESHFGVLDQVRRNEGAYSSAANKAQGKSYNDNVPLKPEQDLQQLLDMGLSRQEAQEILNEHLSVLMVPPEMRPYMQEEETYVISKTVTRRLVRESRHRHSDRRQHREHHTSSRSMYQDYHRHGDRGYAGSSTGSYDRSRNEIYYENDAQEDVQENDSYYSEEYSGRPVRYGNHQGPSSRNYSDGRAFERPQTYIENDPYYRGSGRMSELVPSESFYSQDSSSYDNRYPYQQQRPESMYDPRYAIQAPPHQMPSPPQPQYFEGNHSDSFYSASQDSYSDYQMRRPPAAAAPLPYPVAGGPGYYPDETVHYNPNNESFYSRDGAPSDVQYAPQQYHHPQGYDDRQQYRMEQDSNGHNDSFYSQESFEPPAVQRSDTRSTVSSLGRSSYGAMEDSFARKNRKKSKKSRAAQNRDQFQPMEPIYEQQYQQSLPPTPMESNYGDDRYSDAGFYPPRAPSERADTDFDDYYSQDTASRADSEFLHQYEAMYRGGGQTHQGLSHQMPMRRTDSFLDEREELNELLEMQEEQFGVNMFDSLLPQDERKIQDLMQMGFSRNIGVQMVFEEKYGVVNENGRR